MALLPSRWLMPSMAADKTPVLEKYFIPALNEKEKANSLKMFSFVEIL